MGGQARPGLPSAGGYQTIRLRASAEERERPERTDAYLGFPSSAVSFLAVEDAFDPERVALVAEEDPMVLRPQADQRRRERLRSATEALV